MEQSPPLPDPDLTAAIDARERAGLFALLERELRGIAAHLGARGSATLQPTALVNEAWIKLCGDGARSWNDRAHFLRSATLTMRRILVDHRKERLAQKRGGNAAQEPLDEVLHAFEQSCGVDILALHEALDELARFDREIADYVNLRFFGGRSNDEAARILGIGERTGDRHWAFARAWLRRRLQ